MRERLFVLRLCLPRLAWAACPLAVGSSVRLGKARHAISGLAVRPLAASKHPCGAKVPRTIGLSGCLSCGSQHTRLAV